MADSIDLLKAIAHPSRYAILAALADGELNVGEIEAATGIGQPTLSQQLSVLRKAGLVGSRREAKLVYYTAEPDVLGEAIASLAALAPPAHAPAAAGSGTEKDISGAVFFARMD